MFLAPVQSRLGRLDSHELEPPRSSLVIVATTPESLLELCGISLLERMLRTLQRLGFTNATVFSPAADKVSQHLEKPSWARKLIAVNVRQQKNTALTCGELLPFDPGADGFLVVSANEYFDPRLLAALGAQRQTALLIDSNPPAPLRALLEGHPLRCGVAFVETQWLLSRDSDAPLFEQLSQSADADEIALVEIDAQPAYIVHLRRDIRPLWFPAPISAAIALAERLILDAAQNGTLDLPAKVHAPIETWIIARLCKTRITPMQITLFTAAVSAMTAALFAAGHLLAGTILALIVGILDGLDGKQARVKVETTELGKREHVLDYILELSWWSALAYHFNSTRELPHAYALLVLLVTSDLCDRIAKRLVKKRTARNLDDLAPIDRFVRLIGGRRNIYVWILAGGLALGAPDQAFLALCLWGALTAAVHGLRALWILARA